MELRSEIGNQVEQSKTGKHELKSQIYKKCGCAGRARKCAGWHKCAEAKRFIVAFVPDVTRVVPDDVGFVPDVTHVMPGGKVTQ